jgi:glutamine synthetase
MRAIPSDGPPARIENRLAGADANPYLVLAANIAAGLHGVRGQLTPPEPLTGNAFVAPVEVAPPLPNTLAAATAELRASEVVRGLLGEQFVTHYAETRDWEISQFAKHVTDWETERYLEII